MRVTGIDLDPFSKETVNLGAIRSICQIMIVKPSYDVSIAEKCLNIEGLTYETRCIYPSKNYGEMPEAYAGVLTQLWHRKTGFINVEHDVAPWPGSIEKLWNCPRAFCCHQYPTWPRGTLTSGIGCMKFGTEIIQKIPNSWEDWGAVAWWDLDGAIVSHIKEAGFELHIHEPAIAHARRPMGASE